MGQLGGRSDSRPVREVIIPYRPRPIWQSFHASKSRWRVVVAHRRAGKTVASVNELIRGAIMTPNNARFGYLAPFLGQAKAIAWDYIKHYCRPIDGVKFNEAELRADLPNGGRIRLFGADNPDALRGQYFDGIVLDEFGDIDPRAWTEVIRPALSDRKGWAAFTGTPRGKNEFYAMRQRAKPGTDGYALWELRASETGILSEQELADARNTMDEASYLREYECSFDAAVEGAYYSAELAAAEREKRICRILIEPTVKIDTGWDIGIDDATAIWFFQDIGLERRFVDYLETSGEGLQQIVKRLEDKRYRYGRMILPHDADAREIGSGRSYREQLQSFGMQGIEIVPRTEDLNGDINLTRLMLAKCWFDEDRCARGIEALKQYRREWDGKRQTWRERPLHDWTSHGADAIRQIACSRKPHKQTKPMVLPKYGIV